ncbi:MAG: choice-of-anchor U domain-containing protein, partial [Candidatus Micrarchaeaceae archaeon]
TTISIPSSSGCDLGNGASTSAASVAGPTGYTALTSLTSFRIYCGNAGTTVPVSVIFDKVYTNPVAWYYNTSTHAYNTIPGASFTTVTIDRVAKTELLYTLTDGSGLDEDGIANGIIVDPVALYNAVITAPNTGYGLVNRDDDATMAYIITLGIGMALAGISVLRRQSGR